MDGGDGVRTVLVTWERASFRVGGEDTGVTGTAATLPTPDPEANEKTLLRNEDFLQGSGGLTSSIGTAIPANVVLSTTASVGCVELEDEIFKA